MLTVRDAEVLVQSVQTTANHLREIAVGISKSTIPHGDASGLLMMAAEDLDGLINNHMEVGSGTDNTNF